MDRLRNVPTFPVPRSHTLFVQLSPAVLMVSCADAGRAKPIATRRGTFTFTLTLRDQGGQRVDQQTTITIN